MLDVAAALEHVDIGRRPDVYFTLQTLLIHRHQDLATFDEAFRLFWRPPPGEWSTDGSSRARRAAPVRRAARGHDRRRSGRARETRHRPSPTDAVEAGSYGSQEVLRAKDFGQFTEEELARAHAMIASLDVGSRHAADPALGAWPGRRARSAACDPPQHSIRRRAAVAAHARSNREAPAAGAHLRRERVDGTVRAPAAPLHLQPVGRRRAPGPRDSPRGLPLRDAAHAHHPRAEAWRHRRRRARHSAPRAGLGWRHANRRSPSDASTCDGRDACWRTDRWCC